MWLWICEHVRHNFSEWSTLQINESSIFASEWGHCSMFSCLSADSTHLRYSLFSKCISEPRHLNANTGCITIWFQILRWIGSLMMQVPLCVRTNVSLGGHWHTGRLHQLKFIDCGNCVTDLRLTRWLKVMRWRLHNKDSLQYFIALTYLLCTWKLLKEITAIFFSLFLCQ